MLLRRLFLWVFAGSAPVEDACGAATLVTIGFANDVTGLLEMPSLPGEWADLADRGKNLAKSYNLRALSGPFQGAAL